MACAVRLEGSGHRARIFHFTGHIQRSAAQLTKSVFILSASLMLGESKTGFVVSNLVWAPQRGITRSSLAALRGGGKESQDTSQTSGSFGCNAQKQEAP